jgi:hypothetical protein
MSNVSGLPIRAARLSFALPDVNDRMLVSFTYGEDLWYVKTAVVEKGILQPGDTFEFKLKPEQYDYLIAQLAKDGSALTSSRFSIGGSVVIFEDGSAWNDGCILAKDPANSCTRGALWR